MWGSFDSKLLTLPGFVGSFGAARRPGKSWGMVRIGK